MSNPLLSAKMPARLDCVHRFDALADDESGNQVVDADVIKAVGMACFALAHPWHK